MRIATSQGIVVVTLPRVPRYPRTRGGPVHAPGGGPGTRDALDSVAGSAGVMAQFETHARLGFHPGASDEQLEPVRVALRVALEPAEHCGRGSAGPWPMHGSIADRAQLPRPPDDGLGHHLDVARPEIGCVAISVLAIRW
jgi:hypothetical protein